MAVGASFIWIDQSLPIQNDGSIIAFQGRAENWYLPRISIIEVQKVES
jgi:hypothetical protein